MPSSAPSGDGVPMIAITSATPSAAPTCRATEFSPVAVAKSSPGADATAAPARLGNNVPAPTPSRMTMPGSHSPTKSGVIPTCVTNHITAAAPDQPAGDEHRTMSDLLHEPARRPGHGGGDERTGRQRQTGLEHRVPPHAGQEQHVGERVAVEAGRGDDRHRVRRAERPDLQQREVDDRRAVPAAPPHEHGAEDDRDDERADDPRAAPSPFLALDDGQHKRGDRQGEHHRPQQVRHAPTARARGSRPTGGGRAPPPRSRSGC